MEEQIRKLLKRFEKVEELLGHADVLSDQKTYRELTQEHAYLSQVKDQWQNLQALQKQVEENHLLLKSEKDPEFQQFIREEIASLEIAAERTRQQLENLLFPPILEIIEMSF